jgi:prevent-host-death family protein
VILKNITEAKAELSALLEAVARGEEVIIGKAGVPVARLVRYDGRAAVRQPGALRGQISVAEDFDRLPNDLAEAFGQIDS